MSRIRILAVGKSDEGEYARGVERYVARASRHVKTELCVVKEETPGRKPDVPRLLAKEAERLTEALAPRDHVVLCDAGGKERSSSDLARDLRRWLDAGPSSVTFVLGGAFGLDPALRAVSRDILSLSRLTLPHQLARVVLAEQIYRAVATLSGVAYSK